ncbi:shufflon system plasmid conjugative transfer pilus tip adhesin PilV, partial [Vibrio campbellii]|uniref:shufflon system plasmid conjugative transfer pilus tip adhesin PilV n=3 Tax=Vibrio harveyi group TaxID=717610 RepID=UPI00215C03E2
NEYVAQGIAARLGGVASGNVVAVTVPVPANASITESSLARFAVPGDPSRNRMETDIDMNNFGLQNVQVINGQAGNFNTGTFASSLHSQGTAQVDGNATFGSSVSVAETVTAKRVAADEVSGTVVNGESASFNGLTVEGGAAVNGLLQVNSLQSASTINGVEVNATKSITTPLMVATTVDATEVLADSAVIRGGLTAETGSFNE